MQVATVKLRNKATGAIIKVNASDYAADLGQHKYRKYSLASTYRGDETSEQEKAAQAESQGNAEKLRKDSGADTASLLDPTAKPANPDGVEVVSDTGAAKIDESVGVTRRSRSRK